MKSKREISSGLLKMEESEIINGSWGKTTVLFFKVEHLDSQQKEKVR